MPLLGLLFSGAGVIDRTRYATIGIVGFFLKHLLDITVATAFKVSGFLGYYSLFSYWTPFGKPLDIRDLSQSDYLFLTGLLVLALPFVWVGSATTVKRLRALDWPIWLVVFFFVPVVNLAFFALLVALPDAAQKEGTLQRTRGLHRFLDRMMPIGSFASAAMALALTTIFGVAAIGLSTVVFRQYGWGVFVAVPVCQGMLAALLLGYRSPRSLAECLGVAELSVLLGGVLLLAVALEGAGCIIMAAPLALLFAGIGAVIGYQIQRRPAATASTAALLVIVLAAPSLMAADQMAPLKPPLLTVTTTTIVHAAPAIVWRNVVRFPELDPPTETIFKLGVAYPMRARIEGIGKGATRYCEFSTGAFVEPITAWDEPHVLAFDVTRNPEPMTEWSPYKHLITAHLRGYLIAERGEFRLVPLPGGDTLLIGTTWYRDNVWPADYWRLWSDAIIHAIHVRVLNHIKARAEVQAAHVREVH
jgi:uncharacterized membrane protein YhaH (DUF805 family)